MKYKIRFQCKSDLRILRECFKLSKEYVANEIGYSVRNLGEQDFIRIVL